MTDVLTPLDEREAGPAAPDRPRHDPVASPHPAWLALAVVSACAGVIHLVMVPSHLDGSTVEGVGFALAGWLQIGLAAAAIVRPSRRVLQAAVAVNASFVAVWAWSRTRGLPIGDHPGEAEPAAFADLTCVALELAIVALAVTLLSRAGSARAGSERTAPRAAAVVGIVAALTLTTAALAAPSTRDHGHHGDPATLATAAGASHDGAAGHDETATHDHDPAAAPTGPAEPGHFGDTHEHTEYLVQYDDLPATTQRQIDITRTFYEAYPVAADAAANGWYKGSVNLPGIAAHYWPITVPGATTPEQKALAEQLGFDIYRPMLLYDGEGPDAPIVGVSYMVEGVPPGFDGDWDVWHEHLGVCLKDMVAIADIGNDPESKISLTHEGCVAAGGTVMSLQDNYMVHVWSRPGYESSSGIFSHDHPDLY